MNIASSRSARRRGAKAKASRSEAEAGLRPATSCIRDLFDHSTGSTITNLPIEPLFMNLMRPVILANRVSSLPRPTFSPGFTARAALPNNDGAAGHKLPAESFESKPLRVRIAAVP